MVGGVEEVGPICFAWLWSGALAYNLLVVVDQGLARVPQRVLVEVDVVAEARRDVDVQL